NVHPRQLHVHLGISRWHGDVFTVRINPACFFPATDGDRLANLIDTWNEQSREIVAIVHGSSDPQRIGVVARSCRRIRETVSFEEFASSIDRAIVAAVELFGELTPLADAAERAVELPSPFEGAQPVLRDAG